MILIHQNFRIGLHRSHHTAFDPQNKGHSKKKNNYVVLDWVLPQIHHPKKD